MLVLKEVRHYVRSLITLQQHTERSTNHMERPWRILHHLGERGTAEERETKTREHRGSRHVSYEAILEEDAPAPGLMQQQPNSF